MARTSHRRAFTMIELLVAVALATIVVTALYGLFVVQSRQLMLAEMQATTRQNLRFAVDIITRTARMAGYGTGSGVDGVLGFTAGAASASSDLPPVISDDAWDGATDAATFVYADPSLEMMTSSLAVSDCSATTITFPMERKGYKTIIASYEAGDLLLCWDYAPITGTDAWMWVVASAGDPSTGTISVNPASGVYSDFDGSCPSGDNLPLVMHCSRGHVVTYYVDNTDDGVGPGSDKHPVLMMDLDWDFYSTGPSADDVPLVDDVEDLQFAWCHKEEDCATATNFQNSLETDVRDPWMVRVSVVARTMRDNSNGTLTSSPISLENHSPSSTTDGYWRQAMTTSVTLRNLRLQYSP